MRWKSEGERERQSKSREGDETRRSLRALTFLASLHWESPVCPQSVQSVAKEANRAKQLSRLVSSHGRRLPVKLIGLDGDRG